MFSECCCVHDCINGSGQCVSLEGRLKVTEGLGEQTVPRNPDLRSLSLTVTVKMRRESSGTSGRPQSRGDGAEAGRTETRRGGSWESAEWHDGAEEGFIDRKQRTRRGFGQTDMCAGLCYI